MMFMYGTYGNRILSAVLLTSGCTGSCRVEIISLTVAFTAWRWIAHQSGMITDAAWTRLLPERRLSCEAILNQTMMPQIHPAQQMTQLNAANGGNVGSAPATATVGIAKGAAPTIGAAAGADIGAPGWWCACAAGATTGVAPGAGIVPLAIAGPDGKIANANVVAALNWVATPGNVQRPAVVNMSLGGPQVGMQNWVPEYAVMTLAVSGIPVVVSAGNDSYPATWNYPASSAFALTVGATDIDDHPAVFSNFGPVVGIWAPGVGILAPDWLRAPGPVRLRR